MFHRPLLDVPDPFPSFCSTPPASTPNSLLVTGCKGPHCATPPGGLLFGHQAEPTPLTCLQNNRCVSGQIKSAMVENVATSEVKIGDFGKVCRNWKNAKKLGNRRIPQQTRKRKDQDEEKLCKSTRRNCEKHAILAEVGVEYLRVTCIDDATRKELPRHQMRQTRERELKYLRDLGVYEKVGGRGSAAQHQVKPVDTKCIDTNKSENRPDLCARTPSEVLKALISIAANHWKHFQSCTSTCHVHTFTQNLETCAGTVTSGRQNGRRQLGIWSVEKE